MLSPNFNLLESMMNLEPIPNSKITWPQVMSCIAQDLLGVTEEYLSTDSEKQAKRLDSWDPLLSVRTNAEVSALKTKADVAKERMKEIATSIDGLIKKVEDVEAKKATLSAETCLTILAEVQNDYKNLRSKYRKILINGGIEKLIQKIQEKLDLDNYRSISGPSKKFIIEYHDEIDDDKFKEQIDLCHKNTNLLKRINPELQAQYSELTKVAGYVYKGGPINTLEVKWEQNCKQLMNGTATISTLGNVINSTCETANRIYGNEIPQYNILNTDLTRYKESNVIQPKKKSKGITNQLADKDEVYSESLAKFFLALNNKLTDAAKIIYNKSAVCERSRFAMLYASPKKVYKELRFLGRIPNITKKSIASSIKVCAEETVKKFVMIKDKLSKYSGKIKELDLAAVSQFVNNESPDPNEKNSQYLLEFETNQPFTQKFATVEPSFTKLVNSCIKYGNLYKKLSQNEIDPLTMPCYMITQELTQLSKSVKTKPPSVKAIQQVECAFDTNKKRLEDNCSLLLKRKEDLKAVLLNLNEKESDMITTEQEFIEIYNDKAKEIHEIACQIKSLKGSGEIQAENKGFWDLEIFGTTPNRNYIHEDIKAIPELQEFVAEGQDSSEETEGGLEKPHGTGNNYNFTPTEEENTQARLNALNALKDLEKSAPSQKPNNLVHSHDEI